MRGYRIIFSDSDRDNRFFVSRDDAHAVLTREGFTVPNPHWPESWEIRPDRFLPNYIVRASGEYVETENA